MESWIPASGGLAMVELSAGLAAERSVGTARGQSPEGIRKAAREFEAYFIAYLMKVMRETVPNGFLTSRAAEHYYYFYDQEIGRLAAQDGGFGLAKFLEENLPTDSVIPAKLVPASFKPGAGIQDNSGPRRPPG